MSSWSSPAARVSGDSSTAHAVAARMVGGTFNQLARRLDRRPESRLQRPGGARHSADVTLSSLVLWHLDERRGGAPTKPVCVWRQ